MERRSELIAKIISGKKVSEIDVEVRCGETYEDLLSAQGINPETVVVLNKGEPVPFDDIVQEGEISIIRVVSSG